MDDKTILQEIAKWAVTKTQDGSNLDSTKDLLNKISELSFTLSNWYKCKVDSDKEILAQTLENWSKAEKTPIEYKAKWR